MKPEGQLNAPCCPGNGDCSRGRRRGGELLLPLELPLELPRDPRDVLRPLDSDLCRILGPTASPTARSLSYSSPDPLCTLRDLPRDAERDRDLELNLS